MARDNFGPRIAQIAAVALLIDYTVTVAVQTSAGTAALTSALPSLVPFTVAITVFVVLVMLVGNLRGIREAGSIFAIPTYFYRQYVEEEEQLETGAVDAAEAPVLPRHAVVVVVGRLDMATARAVRYARTLRPDILRFVHFDLDAAASRALKADWNKHELGRLPLDIAECRDRRIERAALEYVADIAADGKTECTVLLPRRAFRSRFERALHDRTAERVAAAVGRVPHVAATIAPFNVQAHADGLLTSGQAESTPARRPLRSSGVDRELARRATGTVPIREIAWRERVRVAGRIRSLRVQTARGTTNLECVITDDTGYLPLVFQGRPRIPGIEPGARLIIEGMVGSWSRRLAILNPDYELVSE